MGGGGGGGGGGKVVGEGNLGVISDRFGSALLAVYFQHVRLKWIKTYGPEYHQRPT